MKNPNLSSTEISSELDSSLNKTISPQSIRKFLVDNDLGAYKSVKKPLINKQMAKKRLEFCEEYADMDWSKVIFSDESRFMCFSSYRPPLVRRPIGKALDPKYLTPTIKHPASVMVWGCFKGDKIGPLYIVENTMNSIQYRDVLNNKLLPFYNQFEEAIYQDDSAPCHRSKMIKKWHEAMGSRHYHGLEIHLTLTPLNICGPI